MRKIAVLGAASPTGRLLLDRLAAVDDLAVIALARDRPESVRSSARWFIADATDPTAVADAVTDVQVIVTLVAAARKAEPGRVRSEATRVLLAALADARAAQHLIVISALGGSDSRHQLTPAARWVYGRAVGPERFAEVDRQEQLLAVSRLPTTVVRPPRLDARPGTGYKYVSDRVGASATLHREDLASCLAELVTGEPPDAIRFVTVVSHRDSGAVLRSAAPS